jgi:hypothetical protein
VIANHRSTLDMLVLSLGGGCHLPEVSARLERSLVAYIGLQAPDPAAVRTVAAGTVTILTDGFTDEDWIHNGVALAAATVAAIITGILTTRANRKRDDAKRAEDRQWDSDRRAARARHGIAPRSTRARRATRSTSARRARQGTPRAWPESKLLDWYAKLPRAGKKPRR